MGMDNLEAAAMVFDLETLPIESAADFMEPVEAPENYKDPIKIRAFIAEHTPKKLAKCSLDPDLCRIAVLGWLDEGEPEPIVVRILSEDEERCALRMFWQRVTTPGGSHRRTISFYGLSFDWPVIVQRSRYLGVVHSIPNLDKYRTPHYDLHAKLTFNGATKHTHDLDFYAKRFGVPLPADDIDGSQVAAAIEAGEWEKVLRHCRFDILKTAAIAHRIGALSTAPNLSAVEGAVA